MTATVFPEDHHEIHDSTCPGRFQELPARADLRPYGGGLATAVVQVIAFGWVLAFPWNCILPGLFGPRTMTSLQTIGLRGIALSLAGGLQPSPASDGERTNTYRLDPATHTLILSVTVTGLRLPGPLVYTLAYR